MTDQKDLTQLSPEAHIVELNRRYLAQEPVTPEEIRDGIERLRNSRSKAVQEKAKKVADTKAQAQAGEDLLGDL